MQYSWGDRCSHARICAHLHICTSTYRTQMYNEILARRYLPYGVQRGFENVKLLQVKGRRSIRVQQVGHTQNV